MMPCAAAKPTFEEARRQRVEALLPRRVPDLHLQLHALDLEDLHLEVDRDRGQVVHQEVALVEALQHAGLADAAFPDQQDLH